LNAFAIERKPAGIGEPHVGGDGAVGGYGRGCDFEEQPGANEIDGLFVDCRRRDRQSQDAEYRNPLSHAQIVSDYR